MGCKTGATQERKNLHSSSEYISALGFADEIKKFRDARTEF